LKGVLMSGLVNLKALRKASGQSQQEAADGLGLPLGTYRNWEQGLSAPKAGRPLVEVAEYFHCRIDDLFGYEGVGVSAGEVVAALLVQTPLVGAVVGEGGYVALEELGCLNAPVDLVACYPQGFFVRVQGGTASKVIQDGAYAFVDPAVLVSNGDVVFARALGGEAGGESTGFWRYWETEQSVLLSPSSIDRTCEELRFLKDEDGVVAPVRVLGKMVWAMYPIEFEF
jgi:transcriptional regulator with XRE-family HTH domain